VSVKDLRRYLNQHEILIGLPEGFKGRDGVVHVVEMYFKRLDREDVAFAAAFDRLREYEKVIVKYLVDRLPVEDER
jgi:hypothetical protein